MLSLVKRIVIVLLALIAIVCGMTYYILSGRTFYADYVSEQVANAINELGGYDVVIDDLSGNPMTGVYGETLAVSHDGAMIISASRVEMRVDLASVMGTPKLARLALYGVSADLDTLMQHLPPQKEGSSPPALARLSIAESRVSTSWGALDIKELDVYISDGEYDVYLTGSFMGEPVDVAATIAIDGKDTRITKSKITWGGADLSARGSLLPTADAACKLTGLDLERISPFVPQIDEYQIKGAYAADIAVYGGDDLAVSCDVSSAGGSVMGEVFSDLAFSCYFSGNNLSIRDARVNVCGGSASCETSIVIGDGALQQIDAAVSIDRIDLKSAKGSFPSLEGVDGIVSATCRVKGTPDKLAGSAEVSSPKVIAKGNVIEDVKARIDIASFEKLEVDGGAKFCGTPFKASGRVTLVPQVAADITITGDKVKIENFASLAPQIKNNEISGTGAISIALHAKGDDVEASGSMRFDEVSAMKAYKVRDASADFSLTDGKLSLPAFRGSICGAEVEGATYRPIDTKAKAPSITLEGRLSMADISTASDAFPQIAKNSIKGQLDVRWRTEGGADDISADISITSPKISVRDVLDVKGISASARYRKGAAEIVSGSASALGSPITASGVIKLSGAGAPTFNVKGTLTELDPKELVKLGLISDDISGSLTCDWRVWNESAETPSVRLYFKNTQFVYGKLFNVRDVRGNVVYDGSELRFDRFMTQMNSGDIELSGTVGGLGGAEMDPDKMPLDLEVSFRSADIGRISRMFSPDAKGFQGMLSGSADITGSAGDPSFKGAGRVSAMRAFGLFFPNIEIRSVKGSKRSILIPDIVAQFGRGYINSRVSVDLGEQPDLEVTATGRSVDIRSLTFTLDRETRRSLIGSLDFDFSGRGWTDSFSGGGSLNIPSFTGMGIKVTNISAPFWVSQGYVIVEDSRADFYGGVLNVQIAKDIVNTNWGGRFDIKSADLKAFLQDAMPEMEGSVSGSADLHFRVGGSSSRTSLLDGGGYFNVKDGTITGFPAVESVSKAAGGRPITFSLVHVPFLLDGETFYFLPGTRASAPPDDPIFKYLTVDGSILLQDRYINLSCLGNINLRSLNSLVGGLQGVMNAAMSGSTNKDELLSTFLGGAISGMSKNQFRDVSLNVKGTSDDLRFSNVTIAEPLTHSSMPEVLSQSNESNEKKEDKFSVTVEFPVGPGTAKDENVGGQIGGQVLEQTLKSILKLE